MLSCKPVDTPISTSQTTILPDPLFSDATRFRKIVGALQYLTFTRPNICFAINRVCHFMCCYPIFDPCFDKFSEKIQK
jgi:hypothetical protein